MNIDIIKRFAAFVALCLVQALVLNHIHLFACATPLLYVYFVTSFNRNYPKWAVLLWCFTLGLCIDIFSNTPGVASGAMTLLAVLQPYVLNMFIQTDSPDDLYPSIRTLGVTRYVYYTLLSVLVYCIAFFSLEAFSFFNWLQWLLNIAGSTVLTVLLIVVVDNIRKR